MGQREQWIDIGKGLAIILMVIGHTSIPHGLSNFIWAFHMPFFFLVSGWVTHWNKTSFKEFVIRRSKSLLVPFFVYSLIVLSIYSLIGNNKWHDWLFLGWGGYALWFVPVLYVASIIAKMILMTKKEFLTIVIIIILIVLGAALRYMHISLPWTMCSVPYATALIMIGAKVQCVSFKNNVWLFLISFAITITVSLFWRLDMASNQIIPVLPLTIGALAGCIMLLCLSQFIEKHSPHVSNVLSSIGRETYVVMAFSQIFILFLNYYTSLGSLLRYFLLIVALVIVTFLKNKFNRLVGKKIL